MSDSKHTQGPWTSEREGYNTYICPPKAHGSWRIAKVYVRDEENSGSYLPESSEAEMNANICLIAAAPELLNALELAEATIVRLDRHAPGAQQGTLDVVRAVIQKAKGAL